MIKMISEFKEGDRIRQNQFLIGNVTKGVNASGSMYLNIELRDSSGSISGKKWEVVTGDENFIVPGNVVLADLDIIKYKDSLQAKIVGCLPVDQNEIDVAKFVKAPPVSKEELITKFNYYVNSIQDEELSKIVHYFIKKHEDKLYTYPAGVNIHHEYSSGLLMHVTTMADIAEYLLKIYHGANRDLLIAGILLHDIGKLTELEGPVVYKYTLQGKLVGHISIMMGELHTCFEELHLDDEKTILLEHMILSHHGQPEFGSPVIPMTIEALLLSMVDNLDSKMVYISKMLETVKEGEFTSKLFPLDNRSLYHHK